MKPRQHKSPSDIRHSARRRERRRAERVATMIADIPAPTSDCVDCGRTEHRVTTGGEIYPHRPDLTHKRFLICECSAYVGFHAGTDIPLGRPGGRATQRARREAHSVFDALWMAAARRDKCSRPDARRRAYAWLAEQLGIEARACHIGWMSAAEALRIATICAPFVRKAA